MSDSDTETFSSELAKNNAHARHFENMALGVGAGAGTGVAISRGLKGGNFILKMFDFAAIGALIGIIARLWTEPAANQRSAAKLDAKMGTLENENDLLKKEVVELGGQLPEPVIDHAEKIKSERAAVKKDCGCAFKK